MSVDTDDFATIAVRIAEMSAANEQNCEWASSLNKFYHRR